MRNHSRQDILSTSRAESFPENRKQSLKTWVLTALNDKDKGQILIPMAAVQVISGLETDAQFTSVTTEDIQLGDRLSHIILDSS